MLKCCLYPEAGKAGQRKDAWWGEGGVSHCSLFAAFVSTLAIKTKLLRKMKEGGEIGTLCGHNTHFYLHGSFIVLVRTELGEAECWRWWQQHNSSAALMIILFKSETIYEIWMLGIVCHRNGVIPIQYKTGKVKVLKQKYNSWFHLNNIIHGYAITGASAEK